MENPAELFTVYLGPLVEAQRAFSMLKGHGIDARLLDQNSAIGYGFFPVSVVVRTADFEAARDVLEEFGLRAET